jgi:hypothetical protein
LGGRAWASHSFADFINPNWASIAADYRTRFVASERLVAPRLSVGVVATVPASARRPGARLVQPDDLSVLESGRLVAVPPVDRALRYLETRRRSYELLGRLARSG